MRVKFIDCEYAGVNPRGFDLANHFCEWAGLECNYAEWLPDESQRRTFYHAYLNSNSIAAEEDQLEAEWLDFEPLPHLLWTLWSLLQAQYSERDFDYLTYGMKRYKRLCELIPLRPPPVPTATTIATIPE